MTHGRLFVSCVTATLLAACAQIEGLDSDQRVPCLDDCPADGGQADAAIESAPSSAQEGTTDAAPIPPTDAAADTSRADSSPADTGSDAGSDSGPTWSFRRAVALTSDAPAALSQEPVLVVLPSTFDGTHAKTNGDDLRFSTSALHGDDLPYFIESWSPGASSFVWVRVPSVPVGPSTIYMFYGDASAAAASDFATTFPNAIRTTGGGAGSFVATGDISTDWFELRAGDTLLLPQGTLLTISARRVILSGLVGGNGRGYAGGPVPNTAGSGPGGGGVSKPVNTESSGGGGNAGSGGHGGEHVAGNGGAGGAGAGTPSGDDIAVGSGGGATNANAGGAGGGAVTVLGWRTTVLDIIRADGLQSVGGSDRNGGGGAGGGILIAGSRLELANATLSAIGGTGGDCLQSTGSGGGGGSGGRIKLRQRPNGQLASPASMAVTGGPGGTCAGTTATGSPGSAGTTDVSATSTLVKGVDSTVGSEEAAQ